MQTDKEKCPVCKDVYTNHADIAFIERYHMCIHCLYETRYKGKSGAIKRFLNNIHNLGYTLKRWRD